MNKPIQDPTPAEAFDMLEALCEMYDQYCSGKKRIARFQLINSQEL